MIKVTFERGALADDDPRRDDPLVSNQWWNVTVEVNGEVHHGTASWHHSGEIQDAIYHATRAERPSEAVLRTLAERGQ